MPKLNKPSKPGYKYAHPEETSGKSLAPHPLERILESQTSDTDRIGKGMNPSAESPAQTAARRNAPQGNLSVKDAAGRAVLRSLGRAGGISSAVQAGLELGTELENRTGAGKKFVDSSGLGDAVERAVKRSHEGVKLTPEARERIMTGEAAERPTSRRDYDDTYDNASGMKRGGKVASASRRGDGIAQRGKTKGRMV